MGLDPRIERGNALEGGPWNFRFAAWAGIDGTCLRLASTLARETSGGGSCDVRAIVSATSLTE